MAHRIPADIADLQQAASTVAIWQISLLLFVRTALFGMGLWAITDGLAIFHGFRLHPNFRGLLTRQNPSELWWAWRGTFTNWLVRHIYAPLTARHHPKAIAILGAFTVSWAWHVFGLPFLTNRLSLLTLEPITAWALVNASAVIGHQYARDHDLRILPTATPPLLRRAIHTFLTACLGTFSVTFLSYQGDPTGFFQFLSLLTGLDR
jgi:D-alanyl-lipoteichoic acid acyltransferase DltB (MBOAT superfamily)